MDFLSIFESGAACLPLFLLSALVPLSPSFIDGYSADDFLFSKYLKCVLDVGSQVLQDVLRAFYSRRGLRTRNGTMPLRHFNMRDNKDPYYGEMDSYLDCNIMEDFVDITFSNRILTDLCRDYGPDFSDQCKEQISSLVKERNRICHKYGAVNDFTADVATLKSWVEKIYRGVGIALKVDFERNISEKFDLFDRIMNAELADLESSYLSDLESLKKSKRFKLLRVGFQELGDYYSNLRTLSPCTWIDDFEDTKRFNMGKVFTPPKLWDNKYRGDIPMKDLLTVKMKNKMEPNMLLIKGAAGSGKTSLSRYIVNSWYKKEKSISGLTKFDFVFLIEIGRSNSESIIEYLREELLRDTCSDFLPSDIDLLLQELDILFIIDGYDEHSERAKLLVLNIFDKFPDQRIILTTRLDYQDEVEKVAKMCHMQLLPITLTGFDDIKQKDFSKKVFQSVNRNYNDFWMYLDGRGRVLNDHLALPLTISLLIVLWMDNPEKVNKITTATCLYCEIFCLYQRKLVSRLINNMKGRGKKKLEDKISRLLLSLGEQAWSLLKRGCFPELDSASRYTLEKMCKDNDSHINIEPFEFLSAFLVCEFDHSSPNHEATPHTSAENWNKKYYFLHRTQMEYLAADFLAESIKTKKMTLNDIIKEVSDWKRFSEVVVYLTGNLAKRNCLQGIEAKILHIAKGMDIRSEYYCYWWKLFSESGIEAHIPDNSNEPIHYGTAKHPKIAYLINREHLSEKENWQLDATNVAAGLRLMSLVSSNQLLAKTLVIDISRDVDPFKIPDFYDALRAVDFHWREKTRKSKVKVELYLPNHNAQPTEIASDQFIKALDGWAELQNFTGSLNDITDFSNARGLKTVQCLVTAPLVLNSFVNISTSVRTLRVTVSIQPMSCNPEDIVELNFTGDLELYFYHVTNEQLKWVITVIRRLSGNGLKRLHLQHSTLSATSVEQLVKSLKNILYKTLYITAPEWVNHSQQTIIEKMANFSIEWFD